MLPVLQTLSCISLLIQVGPRSSRPCCSYFRKVYPRPIEILRIRTRDVSHEDNIAGYTYRKNNNRKYNNSITRSGEGIEDRLDRYAMERVIALRRVSRTDFRRTVYKADLLTVSPCEDSQPARTKLYERHKIQHATVGALRSDEPARSLGDPRPFPPMPRGKQRSYQRVDRVPPLLSLVPMVHPSENDFGILEISGKSTEFAIERAN